MFGDAITEFGEASANDIGQLLIAAADVASDDFVKRINAAGFPSIRASHFPVFGTLDPEGTHISVMAKRAGMSRQGMSALVKDVEKQGFVSTSADTTDRRAIVVALTETGAQFCREAAKMSAEINRELTAAMGADRVVLLREALAAIAHRDPSSTARP